MSSALGATFFLYFALLAAIGLAAWWRTRTLSDYVLGSRRLSAVVAALSAGASDMSGWLMLGLPGAVYVAGLGEAWIVVGLAIGAYLNWRLVAPRLRAFTARGATSTLPEFFAHRFADSTPWFQVAATLLILFFFTIYAAAGFVSGAKLFSSLLGVDYATALWGGVIVIMAYTAVGGFLAVSWTDVFQAVLMVAALVVVPILAWQASSAPIAIDWTTLGDPSVIAVVSLLAWGLGYFGQPHIVVRFMALSSGESVRRARLTGMTWMVLCCAGAVSVGLAGHAWTEAGAHAVGDPETIFIVMTQTLLNPWFGGFVLAAILAAIMSTVSSQLLVAATCLAHDALRPSLERARVARLNSMAHSSEATILMVSRTAVVVMALFAGWLGTDPNSRVLALVAYAWAGLGASLGPLMLFALYWRRTTRLGAILGMLAGGATVIAWRPLEGGLYDLYELLPGFVAACATTWLVSLASKPDSAAQATFDALNASDRGLSTAHPVGR